MLSTKSPDETDSLFLGKETLTVTDCKMGFSTWVAPLNSEFISKQVTSHHWTYWFERRTKNHWYLCTGTVNERGINNPSQQWLAFYNFLSLIVSTNRRGFFLILGLLASIMIHRSIVKVRSGRKSYFLTLPVNRNVWFADPGFNPKLCRSADQKDLRYSWIGIPLLKSLDP